MKDDPTDVTWESSSSRPVVLEGVVPGLSSRDATALLSAGHRVGLDAGQVLFAQGGRSSSVGVVLRGHLKMCAVGSSGRSVLLNLWGRGDFVGPATVINGTTRMGTATALDQVDLWVIPAAQFMDLLDRYPGICATVLRQLSVGMETSARCQAVQSTESARCQVARLLVELCDPGADDGGEMAFALRQDELGQIVGLSRESVTRVLATFRDEGLVSTGRRSLRVLRLGRLADIAQMPERARRHPGERLVRRPTT